MDERPGMTIEKVQQWVVSALICAVATFPIGALIATSVYSSRVNGGSDAVVLCVMASVIGVLAVGAGRLVHQLNPISPYVLVGTLPGLVAVIYQVGS